MLHTTHAHQLPSGAQVLVIDVPGTDACLLSTQLNSGYEFTHPDRYEVPHVMEHVVLGSSQGYPGTNALTIEAEKHGAKLNAWTNYIRNGYWYEFAQPDTLQRMLGLVTEYLTRPLFDPDTVKTELGNVREELTRNLTLYSRLAWAARAERAYPGRVRGYQARLGLLDAITAEHLHDHHQATHTASNLRFYAIGAFNDGGTALAEELDRIAGHLPAGSRLQPTQARGLHAPDPIVVGQDIDSVYYEFATYFGNTTRHQRQALDLLEVLLTGTWASRIFGQARRDGLAYHVASCPSTELGYGEFEISGYVSPSNLPRLTRKSVGSWAGGSTRRSRVPTGERSWGGRVDQVRVVTRRAVA